MKYGKMSKYIYGLAFAMAFYVHAEVKMEVVRCPFSELKVERPYHWTAANTRLHVKLS